jgi:hypothetical protein
MSQTKDNHFIGADESVYSDSSLEKLVSRFQSDLSMEQMALSDFTLVPSNPISCINSNNVAISPIVEWKKALKTGGQAIPSLNKFRDFLAC